MLKIVIRCLKLCWGHQEAEKQAGKGDKGLAYYMNCSKTQEEGLTGNQQKGSRMERKDDKKYNFNLGRPITQ